MRISDWSSDVCSSDLTGTTSRQSGAATQAGAGHRPGNRCAFHAALGQRKKPSTHGSRRQVRHRHAPENITHHGRLIRSEEHTSELQSLMSISYAVFCLKKKNKTTKTINTKENQHTNRP